MKTLTLLRHGKAEGHNAGGDHDRVLTDRGVREAQLAGKWIAQTAFPRLVVASDATRARQTGELAAQAGAFGPVALNPPIYEATVADLLRVIASLPDTHDSILLVGHNPGFEELAHSLAASALPFGAMPTAGAAAFAFDVVSWSDVQPGGGTLLGFFSPAALR